MQKLVSLFFLVMGFKSNAQFDTTYIVQVFEFTKTSNFRNACVDSLNLVNDAFVKSRKWKKKDLKRFKGYRVADSTRWMTATFISFPRYYIPDRENISQQDLPDINGDHISYGFIFKGNIARKKYSSYAGPSADSIVFRAYYLHPDIIELRSDLGGLTFGQETRFRFKINYDLSVSLIRLTSIVFN